MESTRCTQALITQQEARHMLFKPSELTFNADVSEFVMDQIDNRVME